MNLPREYPDEHGNGWKEWSKYVLKELERLNTCYASTDRRLQQISVDIAMLKVKAGLWGAMGGALPVAITLAVIYLKKG